LDSHTFPTSVPRQAALQILIYALFVVAWWLAYSRVAQQRLFATAACLVGGVFFSGYIHLFHIYGLFYVPVILTVGTLLYLHLTDRFSANETSVSTIALLLAFWHPFATGLFVGYYFGFYLDTFRQRNLGQQVRALAMIFAGCAAVAALVVLFPREHVPLA